MPRITLSHADIDRIFRQRYKYHEENEERTRKPPKKPSTVNIKLKRELAINTREEIIRNNFYLNSFACCPREIRKFVFSFLRNFFQRSLSSWVYVANVREEFSLLRYQTQFTTLRLGWPLAEENLRIASISKKVGQN